MRIGPRERELPAVAADDGIVYDISALTPDIDRPFFENDGVERVRTALGRQSLPVFSGSTERIGAPVRPGKIVGVGLNYREHAAETGGWVPDEPIVFMKAADTVVGPHDEILLPRGSTKTDWEVELGVVIGRTARYLDSDAEAADCVAGYTISHDLSEREFQLERGGQWVKGKSCETFNPLGPWLVTADEIGDPQALGLSLSVNGERRQSASTADMIVPVAALVRYLSQFMVLYPGDLVNTGTPGGVAMGRPDPKPYLRAGDIVELRIDGLGTQRQQVVDSAAGAFNLRHLAG
jgi:2-keto-4-pentenoate hydratase/2-oxohepta-3-ene-1,7-dioic acid hydratase in catechol pathway